MDTPKAQELAEKYAASIVDRSDFAIHKNHWDADDVRKIIKNANLAGYLAASNRVEELERQQAQYKAAFDHLREANRRLIQWEHANEPYVIICHEYKFQFREIDKALTEKLSQEKETTQHNKGDEK